MKKSSILQKVLNIIPIIISVITLGLVLIIVYKELTYNHMMDTYDNYFVVIDNKLSIKTEIGFEEKFNDDVYSSIQLRNYLECLNNELSYNDLSDKAKLIINPLDTIYNSSYIHFVFKYVDIYT